MPSQPNISSIPPPREPLVDPRTGLITNTWFRWFINIFTITGGGTSPASIVDLLVEPSPATFRDPSGETALQQIGTLPALSDMGPIYSAINALSEQPGAPDLGPLMKALDGLSLAPSPGTGTVVSVAAGTGLNALPSPIVLSGTLSLADTTVTPGSYTSVNITVDQQGRITAAANGAGGTVTSVATGAGLTGGPITVTGTVAIDFASANTWTARQIFNRPNTPVLTVATLPGTPVAGDRAMVSDALAPAFGVAVAAGGAAIVPVYYSGAAWLVG